MAMIKMGCLTYQRASQLSLSANEIAGALISMMARGTTPQSKAGYIDARPLPPYRRNSLATHGRTIHWVITGRTQSEHNESASGGIATKMLLGMEGANRLAGRA